MRSSDKRGYRKILFMLWKEHLWRMRRTPSGNYEKCPFCKADHVNKTDEERVEEFIKRIEANDAGAMCE
jgi:hypothetical protein